MTIITKLNRAAFLIIYGGRLCKVTGRYPNNSFVVDLKNANKKHLKFGGDQVNYKKYMNKRTYLKRMARKKAGLPEKYSGKVKHYPFRSAFNNL